MKLNLWWCARASWMAAVLSFFIPGAAHAAVVDAGHFSLSFNELAIIVAIGCAWGDMRSRITTMEKRIDRLEE